jgi:hypothetical protein
MKTLLTIGTSHVESGYDFIDIKFNMDHHAPHELFFKTWPGYLQTKLTDTRVINLGVSGHGIDWIIARTHIAIDHYKPDIIILEFPSITRFSMTNDKYPYVANSEFGIHNISHVQTQDEYYRNQEIGCRHVLTAGIIKSKSERAFHRTWLENIDEFTFINHLYKFRMLCDYVEQKGIQLHSFTINGDNFLLDNFKEKVNIDIPTHVHTRNIQGIIEDMNAWTFSKDGSGHAGWESEKWMVDNIFVPSINKMELSKDFD